MFTQWTSASNQHLARGSYGEASIARRYCCRRASSNDHDVLWNWWNAGSRSRTSSLTPSPSSECAKFLPDAPCGQFKSTAGTAAGQPISWVTGGHVTAQLDRVGQETYLTAVLPCGPVNTPVTINGSDMTLSGKLAVGASGCVDAAKGDQQTWALKFLQDGVQLNYANGVLTWTRGQDSLTFGAM